MDETQTFQRASVERTISSLGAGGGRKEGRLRFRLLTIVPTLLHANDRLPEKGNSIF